MANATNENLHYSLYRQDGELFTSMSSKTLKGLGVDLRSRALVEHVIEIINACGLKYKIVKKLLRHINVEALLSYVYHV